MKKENVLVGVLIEEESTLSVTEICYRYHIPQELLREMLEEGLFTNQTSDIKQLALDQKSLRRIETAFRLHKDLDINLPGVALALELLDEMDKMRDELNILRKHF